MSSNAVDSIVTIERNGGFVYRVDTSAADKLSTEDVEAYRNQRIRGRDASRAADWLVWNLYGDCKGAETVCPVRRWYKKYGKRFEWVYEFNEVEPGVWSVRPVGRIARAKQVTNE